MNFPTLQSHICSKCGKIYYGEDVTSLCLDCQFPKEEKGKAQEIIIKHANIDVNNENLTVKNTPKPLTLKEFVGQEENKKSINTTLKIIKQIKPINLFIHGYPGCLTGDTFIGYQKQKDGRIINSKGGSLKRLYYIFNQITQKGKGYNHRFLVTDCEYYTASFDEKSKKIFMNKIINVIYSGKKEVFLIETKTGQNIKATADHLFFTGETYTQLKDLKIGDNIYIHNNTLIKNENKGKRIYRKEVSVKFHPFWPKRVINKCLYYRTNLARAIYEAYINNISYKEYIDILNTKSKRFIKTLKFLPINLEIHHKDRNVNNNEISNLELLTTKEHYLRHKEIVNERINYLLVSDRIENISLVGIEDTYDISMLNPARNFIANKIAVHNCGKSTLAEIIANELGAKFIYTIPEQLKNTEKITEVLNTIQENKGLTVWMLDECHNADKKLINILLPILQDHKLGDVVIREFVMIMATTDFNKLYKKSEALISRFQTKIYLEKYSLNDIVTILKQYKQKLNMDVDIPEKDYLLIAENSKGIPREAINLLLKRLVLPNMPEIFKENKIIFNGLNQKDIQILKCLDGLTSPIGANFLSQKVGLIDADYQQIYEPFLIENEYIDRTPKGRLISTKGKELLTSLKG